MKYLKISSIIAILIVTLAFTFSNTTSDDRARNIMDHVLNNSDGDSRKSTMEIVKINRRGKKRLEEIVSYSKDYDQKDEKKTIFFTTLPADVRGISFLTWEYIESDKDDDRWLYLPAMKKTRRISSGSSKYEPFLGTDFAIYDIEKPDLDEDIHTFLKEETIEGVAYWKIQSVPKDKKCIYSKKVHWIQQDNYVITKTMYYDKMGDHIKTFQASDVRKVDGIWTAFSLHMVNHRKKHQTYINTKQIEYNIGLEERLFTVQALERGVIE